MDQSAAEVKGSEQCGRREPKRYAIVSARHYRSSSDQGAEVMSRAQERVLCLDACLGRVSQFPSRVHSRNMV